MKIDSFSSARNSGLWYVQAGNVIQLIYSLRAVNLNLQMLNLDTPYLSIDWRLSHTTPGSAKAGHSRRGYMPDPPPLQTGRLSCPRRTSRTRSATGPGPWA